jgi:KaiC/GvpD/RAD55 family RecA-like ATPase
VGGTRLTVPFLEFLGFAGLEPGRILLVEFEPHSAWYEASYTIAAQAIRAGIRTDYHVFQHEPADVTEALTRLGVEVGAARRKGIFRLIDSYTVQGNLAPSKPTEPYGFASLSLRLKEWKRGALRVLRESGERDILHIDDNDSLLATANSEDEILDFFQGRAFAAARSKRITFLHGYSTGVHSDRFYHRLESFVDGILDFAAWENRGQIDQIARARVLRGTTVDSRWRLLQVSRRGEVKIHGVARPSGTPRFPASLSGPPSETPEALAIEVLSPSAARVFEFLTESFLHDRGTGRHEDEDIGWRSLAQIARGIGLSPSSLYPRAGSVSPPIRELEVEGLLEARVVTGSRGRGGVASKLRIAPESRSVASRTQRVEGP